ncbi:MAG: DEAD/DEAH box helicase family protein [Candidatus Hodarchaeota archaeon]
MQSFPSEAKFKLPWRTYQARILKELEGLLSDNHLHVVAAPGSGKTVLGLEVVLRLNNPTLVLAPTLAIRDQWVERLVALFLEERAIEWISKDIKAPKFFTVSTYQGLHSAMTGQDDKEGEEDEELDDELLALKKNKRRVRKTETIEIISLLNSIGIKTVVVDEAHHLRSQWWKSLTRCIKKLDNPVILALTATPPFDVSESEWKRYRQLCGPVDAEVSVPELVLEKNLCPHQDYIMFSIPSINETNKILKFRNSVREFTKGLYTNKEFIEYLIKHPWIVNPDDCIEDILTNPSYFSSILVFLNHLKIPIPLNALEIIVSSPKETIPTFDYEWLEILLTGLIYGDENQDEELPPFIVEIKRELIQIGALERRIINLRSVKEIERILRRSISKLNSINKIVELEYQALEENLRMVILTDYIRKEFLPRSESDETPLSKIGVVPIFENIRRNLPTGLKLGVLSGSIVIIPSASEEMFNKCSIDCEILLSAVKISKLPYTDDFSTVNLKGINREKIVQIMTKLFSRGGINVLIGTKALLGEGWDAPSINSLILASVVGSYMLSNQMRGRAIRTEPKNPSKTANVWHLVTIEPKTSKEEIFGEHESNEDLNTILRRFKAFVGVSFKEPLIESGVSRLNIGRPPFTNDEIRVLNEMMRERAIDRTKMREEWDKALKKGETGIKLVQNLKARKEHFPRSIIFLNSIESIIREGLLIISFVFIFGAYAFNEVLFESFFSSYEILFIIILILILIAILAGLPRFSKAVWLFIRHGSVESSITQVCKALLKSLCLAGIIKTNFNDSTIKIEKSEDGTFYCHLEGPTNREKAIFLESLQEILDPIENPRYILVRKSLFLNRLGRVDYHAVPTVLGVRKRFALIFAEIWEKYVGKMDLVYTRTRSGRALLLKARNHSLSTAFIPRTERISRWC